MMTRTIVSVMVAAALCLSPRVGASEASASGQVFNLKQLADFDGNYVAVSAGVTAAGGGVAAVMKNRSGVTISVKGTTRGAQIVIGGSGVDNQLLD